ncbi:MAG: biopolymer transporter ExbD [Calditrichaeota bacterium]|nr:biopolymer transporter ExbD [Calditrichota bacterium]MCB0303614.1 biopolymer transporter ExbD [Calditrichota bacterium]MCB9086861.1 biopolymer transporter ExbD [Calditrichia bacterium]
MKLLQIPKKRIILNITPLIDVLFILIIFFVVSSTFLEQPGIKLELPKATSSESQRVEKAVLYITKDAKLFFGEQEVTLESLPGIVKSAMEVQAEKSLIVNADQQVHHGLVVKVMDIARTNGVEKLVISADKE